MELAQAFAVKAGLSNLQPLAAGLEFDVYKATSRAHGAVVLRVPKSKVFQNANDPNVDARALVRQEVTIVELLLVTATSVPVPRCHGYYEIDGHPAMVSEYMPGDDDDDDDDDDSVSADVVDVALGRVAALIHATQVPADWPVALVAMEGCRASEELPTLFVRRMRRRFEVLGGLVPQTRDWAPDEATLRAVAEPLLLLRGRPAALLHMDLRRANVRVARAAGDRGVLDVSAVFDWTNALLGPPVVDVYRSLEWGARGAPFLAGYESVRGAPLEEVSPREEAFLRLDAALVLALVFASEAPDPEKQAGALRRVQELCEALRK
ncbi:dihydropyrimidine dehydrogenase [Cordyceps fumosorosea ARSEF 2679]|uniref:Dihydropyrimidine dehydrogenase n=1 Tax=Cordyceps fumosorosea (strain ARSEF 2679) TaxID=1081104 RepID=A0A167MXU9_CORFA|nr:dihydropyrimidine dehydrogenase [Cordyceps fumosorosea ARSEF 2679]OAA54881.1 dihydropyrimidine dehydrogenase [Cordyceps fumosorosea ARSEF 2679]